MNSCGVNGLVAAARDRIIEITDCHARSGMEMWMRYASDLDRARSAAAKLLSTSAQNIATVTNTAEALSMIANGYPLTPGDQIISYVHEYPSNHYPWVIQARQRGAELLLLLDVEAGSGLPEGRPRGWSMDDLARMVTPRTRIVAVSHVQFASGYATDLRELGEFCYARGIDLVVDAAQSIGVLPIDVETMHISALAASGWKWLAGPVGTGVVYTSESFRSKLQITMAGPELMEQQEDYLDHRWQPLKDARMFEYSTPALAQVGGLAAAIELIAETYGMPRVSEEAKRLRGLLRQALERLSARGVLKPVRFDARNESGIMSFVTEQDPHKVASAAKARGLICSSRGGYLRLAPHYFNTEVEIEDAAGILAEILAP
jgi:selenocysteine lyase/cysteine desulfurase